MKNQFEGGGWGGFELNDQLLDPDVPTLASQDKLKVSPKGLPFVNCNTVFHGFLTPECRPSSSIFPSLASSALSLIASLGIGDDEVPFLLLLLIFHRLFLGPIRRIPIFQSLATGRIHIPQHLGDKRIDGALE